MKNEIVLGMHKYRHLIFGNVAAVLIELPFSIAIRNYLHKEVSAKFIAGDALTIILGNFALWHVVLYKPCTWRQRFISWMYLFAIGFSWLSVGKVKRGLPIEIWEPVIAATLSTVAIISVWLSQRRTKQTVLLRSISKSE